MPNAVQCGRCHYGPIDHAPWMTDIDVRSSNNWLPSRELTYPPKMAYLKMIFLFPRWDMLIPWGVFQLTKEAAEVWFLVAFLLFPSGFRNPSLRNVTRISWKNKSLGTVEGFHLYQWRTLILVLKSQDLSMPLVVQLPKNLVSSFLEITSRYGPQLVVSPAPGPSIRVFGDGWPDEIGLSQWCPPPPLRATITILIIILLITQTTLFESWDPSTLGLHWLHHLSKPQTTRWFQAGCEDLDAHHWQWQGNSQIQQFGAQKCAFC